MKKSELESLAEKYQAKADKAFAGYQRDGKSRQYKEYCDSDELAEALRIAAYSADEHNEYTHMKMRLSEIASEVNNGVDKAIIIKDLIQLAVDYGLIREEKKK